MVKHAQADHLLIQLLHRDGQVMLLVEDNGIGFDLDSARQKKGLGLSGIEARVQYLGGTIEWDSVQGSGTTVLIHIPVAEKA